MTQDLSNIVPEIYAMEALTIIHNTIVMPGLIKRARVPQGTQRGDTVNFPLGVKGTSRLNSADATTYRDASVGKKQVTVNKWRYDKIYLTDKDLTLAMWERAKFIELFVEPMAMGIADAIDQDVLQLYKDIYFYVGTAGDPPDSLADVKAIYTKFKTHNIPKPWHVVMSPVSYSDAMVSEIIKANERGNSGVADTGNIVNYLGMNFHDSSQVDDASGAKHTIGGWYDAVTPAIDQADHAAGDSTAHIDGLDTSASGETKDGDLFIVEDDTTRGYVVTADAASDSNGDADITYSAAAAAAWANDKGITVVKPASGQTYVNNLAFNSEAFGIAYAAMGSEAEQFGGGKVANMMQDEIPMRLIFGYDHTKPGMYLYMDVLYGVTTLRPEMAIRVLGE